MQEKGGFSMVIHVVQPGDSLYRIAQLHGVPLPFLIQQSRTGLRPGRPSLFRSRKRRTLSAAATRSAALPRRTAQP